MIGYAGARTKPDFWHRFSNEKARARRVTEFFADRRGMAEYQAKKKAERTASLAQPHKLAVGHLLYSTWGYEQTNADFYKVLRLVGARSVELVKVAANTTHEGANYTGTAIPGEATIGDPFVKRVGIHDSVRLTSYSSASLWDGRPIAWSAYA